MPPHLDLPMKPPPESRPFSVALKEWSLLCDLLASGGQSILLRKGGIYESGGVFELENNEFLLYPTFVHQNPDMLKPGFSSLVKPLAHEPESVRINTWAKVHWIGQVPDRPRMNQLADMHIWNDKFLDMRFNYRPDYPLYLVLLQVYRLKSPLELPMHQDYVGCRSWVELKSPLNIESSEPVHSIPELQAIQDRILRVFAQTVVFQ